MLQNVLQLSKTFNRGKKTKKKKKIPLEFHIIHPLSLHLWLYSVVNGLGEVSTSAKKANHRFCLGPETSNLNFKIDFGKDL